MSKFCGKDFLVQRGDGTGIAATVSTSLGVANAELTFTAQTVGASGNSITIAYVKPVGNNSVLSVSVTSKAITVNLATDGTDTITSTAAQVAAIINGTPASSVLVTAVNKVGNTGVGIVIALSALSLTSGADDVFTTVAAMKSTGLTINNEQVDVTTKSDMPWKQLLACGIRSMAISLAGVLTNNQANVSLEQDALDSSRMIRNFRLISGRGDIYQGPFQIGSFARTGEYNQAEQYTAALESAGAIAYTAPTTISG